MVSVRDRRSSGGASGLNRERFIDRARQSIRHIVNQGLLGEKVISDPRASKKVSIPIGGIDEPFMRKSGSGGNRHRIYPGNDQFVEGDHIPRPQGGAGDGGREPGQDTGQGDSLDSFQFVLSREEFIRLFFEDCVLPNLRKQSIGNTKVFALHRAGFSKYGSPSQLDLFRTMRKSLGRRIALKRPTQAELDALEDKIRQAEERGDEEAAAELRAELDRLHARRALIPFVEPDLDVLYRRFDRSPRPIYRAVMFCLMDVSGSVSEEQKMLAKRFFYVLRLFLDTRYKQVEVVFIRHTSHAEEVDEQTFFFDKKTGGTMVSTAFMEMQRIVRERYASGWNLYAAQASDGDNENGDMPDALHHLGELLPLLQYYAYIEVGETSRDSNLWHAYREISAENFSMERVQKPEDVTKVFYRLFRRTETHSKERHYA